MASKRKTNSWSGGAQEYRSCVPEHVCIHSLSASRVTQGFLCMFVLKFVFSSKKRFILVYRSRYIDVQRKDTLLRGRTAFIVLILFPSGKFAWTKLGSQVPHQSGTLCSHCSIVPSALPFSVHAFNYSSGIHPFLDVQVELKMLKPRYYGFCGCGKWSERCFIMINNTKIDMP